MCKNLGAELCKIRPKIMNLGPEFEIIYGSGSENQTWILS